MKKKLVVILTVFVAVDGLAFAETYSYWEVYACDHTEEATTSDQNTQRRETTFAWIRNQRKKMETHIAVIPGGNFNRVQNILAIILVQLYIRNRRYCICRSYPYI
mgnify:CR=1 FL=1